MDFGTLAKHYGYPMVVLGTMLQGEAILLVCGFLAHQGYLNLWIVWAIAAVSAMIGDMTYFQLGRHYGEKLIAKLPKRIAKVANSVKSTVSRHPDEVMLSMRFILGMRMLMPTLCGMAPISTKRFFLFNVITAFVWAGLFAGSGYLFGLAAKPFIHDLQKAEIFIILAMIAAALIYHYISVKIKKRKQAKIYHWIDHRMKKSKTDHSKKT